MVHLQLQNPFALLPVHAQLIEAVKNCLDDKKVTQNNNVNEKTKQFQMS